MKFKPLDIKSSLRHLKADKRLVNVIKKHGPIKPEFNKTKDPFQSLLKSIIYQQISGKAAESILKKFLGLFPKKKFPTPEDVLKIKFEKLRGAGLSSQKAAYIIDLARKFKDGSVSSKNFHKMSDGEIIEHLTLVKGIGVWTVQMFLMFTLNRPDILPTGDLGIQKGFQKLFGLKRLPSSVQMEKLSINWRGHRTVASLYLWKMVDERR